MKNDAHPSFYNRPATPLIDRSPDAPPLRLLDQVRARIRVKHYALRTEQVYVDWIKRYIKHFDKRHPRDLTAAHVERYLSYLATEREVAASTQNQAKSAVRHSHRAGVARPLGCVDDDDLHPCPQQGRAWCGESARWVGAHCAGRVDSEGTGPGIPAG